MAAWLLTISETYPQHWSYAKTHGTWDMITSRSIQAEDVVYFWQSGGSLLGKVRVLEDAHPIDVATAAPGPWDDWPGPADKPYVSRFPLEVLAATSESAPRWHDVAARTGLSKNPSFVRTLSPEQQVALDGYLGVELVTRPTLDDRRREEVLAGLDEDMRVRRLQLVALRQGQTRFRAELLRAYGRKCAISGSAVDAVLEAAHIAPHKGEHTNFVANGLLLRADLHTLFDLNLIAIEVDSHRVRVAPELMSSTYADFDGALITTPAELDQQPLPERLQQHNDDCEWLT